MINHKTSQHQASQDRLQDFPTQITRLPSTDYKDFPAQHRLQGLPSTDYKTSQHRLQESAQYMNLRHQVELMRHIIMVMEDSFIRLLAGLFNTAVPHGMRLAVLAIVQACLAGILSHPLTCCPLKTCELIQMA
jgi:hypothetical protein